MQTLTVAAEDGAMNMLTNCAGTSARDRLLIVHEKPGTGYYDDAMASVVADAGHRIGAEVTLREVAFDPLVEEIPSALKAAMKDADQTVFLARIGDQLRFADIDGVGTTVVSYALDTDMLGSSYGTVDHRAFELLKRALNDMFGAAQEIHVICAAGTDFSGPGPGAGVPQQDVGVYRFPMPVFTPVPAARFSGSVVLPGFLVGTGSKYYDPYGMLYDGRLVGHFEEGRITGFTGDPDAVKVAEDHYSKVSGMFGIDRDFIHSWHIGIHPGCFYPGKASDNFERWSGAAFGNPRLLHLHTCGAYAPGEISWNVLDPTVVVDGVTVWCDGVLDPDAVPGGTEILRQYPAARKAFDAPNRAVGM